MVVEGVGGGEDDLLEAVVVSADVAWGAGHGAAKMAAGHQPEIWRREREVVNT